MCPAVTGLTVRKISGAAAMLAIAISITSALQAAVAADLKVISSGAVKEVVEEAVPAFEKASGHKLSITWAGGADIKKRISAGETYDAVIVSAGDIDAFIKGGKLAAGSRVDLMKSGVGIGIKEGAPKPDVSSTEAFKAALLSSKGIGYSTGPSGAYLETLFGKLGIADQIKSKLKQTPSGVAVGTLLVNGGADIGLQQVSELIHYPGVTYLGPLPSDIEYITQFSGAVGATATDPAAANAFLTFLASPATTGAIKHHGME
jgi:molybdate transport system substrate-binding protein